MQVSVMLEQHLMLLESTLMKKVPAVEDEWHRQATADASILSIPAHAVDERSAVVASEHEIRADVYDPCDHSVAVESTAGRSKPAVTSMGTYAQTVPASLELACHGYGSAITADEQYLMEQARMVVQQQMASDGRKSRGVFEDLIGCLGSPTRRLYPKPEATHEEVCASAEVFQQTLQGLYEHLDIKVQRVMKLGGQELNLHLLYQRVTEAGGALEVIKTKQWRDVGDAFNLPKTITSVSFVLKRAYMLYLWDYEQVYFQGQGGQPRASAPQSRYAKDGHGSHDAVGRGDFNSMSRHMPHQHAKHNAALPPCAIDAAAAMAVAALRHRQDWAAAAHSHSYGPRVPLSGVLQMPVALPALSPPIMDSANQSGPLRVAPSEQPAPLHAVPSTRSLISCDPQSATTMPAQRGVSESGPACTWAAQPWHGDNTPSSKTDAAAGATLAGVLSTAAGSAALQLGVPGSITAVAALGAFGYLATGSIGSTTFSGVLARGVPAERMVELTGTSEDGRQAPEREPETATAQASDAGGAEEVPSVRKRQRVRVHGSCTDKDAMGGSDLKATPKLPETVQSLLCSMPMDGDAQASATQAAQTPTELAVARWMAMDGHKRNVVENAVRADEERYRAEQCFREARVALAAARERRDRAMQAAHETLSQGRNALLFAVSAPEHALGNRQGAPGSHGSPVAPASQAGGATWPVSTGMPAAELPMSRPLQTGTPPQLCNDREAGILPEHAVLPGSAGDIFGAEYDPLMQVVFDPCGATSGEGDDHAPVYTGGLPFVKSNPGGRALQRDVLGQQRGPVASPNTVARPLDPSRHGIYPMFHDRFVEPLSTQHQIVPSGRIDPDLSAPCAHRLEHSTLPPLAGQTASDPKPLDISQQLVEDGSYMPHLERVEMAMWEGIGEEGLLLSDS